MKGKEIFNLYPEPEYVDLGDREDNDPPVFEKIDLYKVPQAYVTSYGYIIKDFEVLKEAVSYRHRDSIHLKNILSSVFLKKKIKLEIPCLSVANGWYDGYYHFVLECLPKLFLLKDYIDSSVVLFPAKWSLFHRQWFELLQVKQIQLINDNEVVKTPLAITTGFPARDLNHHHLVIPQFREWVLSHLKDPGTLQHKKIFVGRKNPKHRILLNSDEVSGLLHKYGFTYIEMEDFSVEDQVKLFSNVDQVICVHGAALSNISFCKPGTKIIDLMHEDFKQWCFLKLARVLKLSYTIIPCEGPNEHNQLPGYRNISVNIQQLIQIIHGW